MEFASTALRSVNNGIVMQCATAAAGFNGRGASSRTQKTGGSLLVCAKIKKGKMGPEEDYPWPDKFLPGEITHGALKYLNRFKPLPNPPKPVTLPFERPIVDPL